MSMLVIAILAGAVFAGLGTILGWTLHQRFGSPNKDGNSAAGDIALAKDLLSSLHLLARRVASDVDEHSNSLNHVDEQLATANLPDNTIVAQLVAELVSANQMVQKKLADTEAKLEDLNQQIETRTSEARTDALTGVANRRAFEEIAGRHMDKFRETNEEFALLIVDIDKFKHFNDTYGHLCGDEVLRGVAQLLTENLRGRDIVTRYGGEEFGVILPNTSIGDARRAAEQIRKAVESTHFRIDGQSLSVTISVGVASVLPFEELPKLIKRSDQAMYAAKRAGRNQVFWHDGTLVHPVKLSNLTMQTVEKPTPTPPKPEPPASAPQPNGPRLYPEEQVASSVEPVVGDLPHDSQTVVPEANVLLPEDIDPHVLKNIGNKTLFCQDIRRRIAEWNRGGPVFSVILAGIDQYDELVRTHGDDAARLVLGAVAQSSDAGLRAMDVLALYNNSTIGIVLPKSSLKHALRVGERLMQAVEKTTVLVDGREVRFSLNLGIVEVQEGDEMATLIERARAELALSRATLGAS